MRQEGKTPMQIAEHYQFNDIIEVLWRRPHYEQTRVSLRFRPFDCWIEEKC